MSSFYKMDPAAWDFGTAGLTLEQEAALLRIVNAIGKHDAPVPNIDRVLAGMFRCSTRKARALIEALLEHGKIQIVDGKIHNERASSDMVHRQFVSGSASERGANGGRTRAENAAKALKTNNRPQAIASSRIEENRIDKIDTNVSTKKTGSRLPRDWVLPREFGEWAISDGWAEISVRTEADKFKDYWISKTGQGATKADWLATWRNWMRNSKAPKSLNGGHHGKSNDSTAETPFQRAARLRGMAGGPN